MCPKRIFWNDILFCGFPNPETPFAYGTFILETFLLTELLFWNYLKLWKDIFDISKNVGVQEEKCGVQEETPKRDYVKVNVLL